jgi:hypothetical protein
LVVAVVDTAAMALLKMALINHMDPERTADLAVVDICKVKEHRVKGLPVVY